MSLYDPTNGETPLGDLGTNDWQTYVNQNTSGPTGGWEGGGAKAQQFQAQLDFKKLFGRNPTQSELTMISPAYAGDPNKLNSAQGAQAIAQYFNAQSNTPDQIAKRQQAQYLKDAPQHYDAVNQVFQNSLGRSATQDELQHFGSSLASGGMDPYALQQFVQQQPEYQKKQNDSFQNDLSGKLAGFDQQYFNDKIMPTLQSTYAKQGRSFDSSSFQNAATNSAQAQNIDRQKYIAGVSADQYGQSQSRAYQDYASQVANRNALNNAGIDARYQSLNGLGDRMNGITDYQTQQNLYNQYLAKYGKRNNGAGSLIGGGIGAVAGAYYGGPAGASAGYAAGSSLGGAAQNYLGGSY